MGLEMMDLYRDVYAVGGKIGVWVLIKIIIRTLSLEV